MFLEQPEVLRLELRQELETWLHNRLHGREGIEAGRTLDDALSDLDDIADDESNSSAPQEIRHWLQGKGGT